MGKSAKKKVHWSKRSSKKKQTRKKRARPVAGKARHALRRHRKRHPKSRVASSNQRLFKEAETANYLLHQLLKTTAAQPGAPPHYHPRHHTKDVDYDTAYVPPKFATAEVAREERVREFKEGVPAPDVQMRRVQDGTPQREPRGPGCGPRRRREAD